MSNLSFSPIYRELQESFSARFGPFLDLLQELNGLFLQVNEKIPTDKQSGSELVIMFSLYRQIIEEFNAILILCQSGFSRGAMILLRSMFEHCTTFLYFQRGLDGQFDLKDDNIQRFIDYGCIRRQKNLLVFKEAYQGDLDLNEFEHIKDDFEKVKDQFQIEDCAKCNTTKTAFSWSKLDIVSMAKRAGIPKEITYLCYTEPLAYAHPSSTYIEKRIETDEEGKWDYQFPSESDERRILTHSHLLTLIASEAMLVYSGDEDAEGTIAPHADKWKICWDTIASD